MTKHNAHISALFNELEGPSVRAVTITADKALISLHVDTQLAWFEGHFPAHKVLPGVVQIDWAGKIGKALFAGEHRFSKLTNIKFKSMVLPDTTMDLELHFNAEKGALKFHFFNESESFSMGSFTFIPS